jgi:hypothetical protein
VPRYFSVWWRDLHTVATISNWVSWRLRLDLKVTLAGKKCPFLREEHLTSLRARVQATRT